MAPAPSPNTNSQPSQFQLALALAVAKSRPAALTIREWIAQIKANITAGSRSNIFSEGSSYIDGVELWKKRCNDYQLELHESHSTNMSLEKKNERLRKENERLRQENERQRKANVEQNARARAGSAITVSSSPMKDEREYDIIVVGTPPPGQQQVQDPVAKRKRDVLREDGMVVRGQKATKKAKTGPEDGIADADESLGITGPGSIAVQHLYRAHKCYQQNPPDPVVLSCHLSEAATSLAQHVFTVAKALQQQQLNASLELDKRLREQLTSTSAAKAYTDIQRVVCASSRSFVSLFHGLELLWAIDTEAAKRQHGGVTYSYIQAFNTLLDTITAVCKLIARQQVVSSGVAPSSSPANSSPQKGKGPRKSKATPSAETQIPQELARFIWTMLDSLTPRRNGPHCAFFEGFLFHILERTGAHLYLLTFGHKRGETISDDIVAPPPTAVKAAAVRIEVKILVEILEHAMALAPAFLGSLSSTSTSSGKKRAITKPSKSINPTASKNALAVAAKEKLQATLVHCMFGGEIKDSFEDNDETDEGGGNDTSFLERLRKPVLLAQMPQNVAVNKVEDADLEDWFREKVWGLVGWDLLTKVSDW
ncbi:hypothetical protein EJ08DRAFT_736463 [Tothia fuscella]|uniref:Uncharacterized protein n=1 Tax=Tothia fuscella TaxID=1048955 RepID=A0A9P4NLC0_9PEZI|nr:hypothetical protein EJ08DRAFT_736463 [Tothia fuscella]